MTGEEYVRLQNTWLNAAGIKVGSWVKVTRKADSHESGWNNLWSSAMDAVVGTFVRVLGSWGANGIDVASGKFSSPSCRLPFFILEPAEEPKPEKYQFTPFERVLVRNSCMYLWHADLFETMDNDHFVTMRSDWRYCIPYAGHEHLLGTTDEPKDWVKYYDKE